MKRNLKTISQITREAVKTQPNPEIYLKTAQELEITTSNRVAIEDSVVGIETAHNVHMKYYVLLIGFNKAMEFSKLQIAGFISSEKDFYNVKSNIFLIKWLT